MRGNKLIIFISLMLVTGIIIGLAVPNPGHNSDIVEFSLGGSRMTLQQAINGEKFLDSLPGTVAEIVPQNNGHTAKDIWVSINGVERTLEDSLKMNKGLCGSSAVAYSGKKDPGHLASEIKMTIEDNEMTLQNAIYCTDTKPALSQACNTGDCTPPPSDVCGQPQVAGKYNCRWSGGIPGNPSSSVYACEHSAGTCNHGLYCPGQSTTWCSGSGTYSITCSCSFNF